MSIFWHKTRWVSAESAILSTALIRPGLFEPEKKEKLYERRKNDGSSTPPPFLRPRFSLFPNFFTVFSLSSWLNRQGVCVCSFSLRLRFRRPTDETKRKTFLGGVFFLAVCVLAPWELNQEGAAAGDLDIFSPALQLLFPSWEALHFPFKNALLVLSTNLRLSNLGNFVPNQITAHFSPWKDSGKRGEKEERKRCQVSSAAGEDDKDAGRFSFLKSYGQFEKKEGNVHHSKEVYGLFVH